MGRDSDTSLLFAEPSMLSGFGSIINLMGTPDRSNLSVTPEEADRIAMLSDWYAVGADLNQAIRTYEENHSRSTDEKR